MTSQMSDKTAVIILLSVICLNITSMINAVAMNQTCSAPYSDGGLGYCGPAFCDKVRSELPSCELERTVHNYPLIISELDSKICKQSRDDRCTSKTLKSMMIGTGVKAAYCNDKFLVIHTDTSSGLTNYLENIPIPPESVSTVDGTECSVRTLHSAFSTVKIPLFPTMLETSDPAINNVGSDVFKVEGGYKQFDVAKGSSVTMGLPIEGIIGNVLYVLYTIYFILHILHSALFIELHHVFRSLLCII